MEKETALSRSPSANLQSGGQLVSQSKSTQVNVNRGTSLLVLIACIGVVFAGCFGYGAYAIVYYYEGILQNEEFIGLANQLEISTWKSMQQKVLGLHSMSHFISIVCNERAQWPNCSVPMQPFLNVTDPLIEMGDLRALAFAPIIEPHQVSKFEAFAYKTYEAEGYENMGVSSFGRGVSSVNSSTGERFHDTEGPSLNNKYQILTPVMQIGNLKENLPAVMFQLYSQEARIEAIDAMIDCFHGGKRGTDCVSITNIIHLVQDPEFRPAVLVIHPVSALDDLNTLVGLNYGVINWDTVFGSILSDLVEGMNVVLSKGTMAFTFDISKGSTTLISSSDVHDTDYDSTKHEFEIPFFLGDDHYFVTVYQSDRFAESHRTIMPIYAGVASMLIVLFIFGLVASYYLSVKRKAQERELVVNTKRLFVRFISHEIRTPMNILLLGLDLVSKEMSDFIAQNSSTQKIFTERVLPLLTDWVNLVNDIENSADTAILVLNDLINYDKINLGGMKIEPEPVLVHKLLNDTIGPFLVQARQANVTIKLSFDMEQQQLSNRVSSYSDIDTEDTFSISELFIMADPIKMSQVFRTLISNSLKFSPPNTTIDISVTYRRGSIAKTGKKVFGSLKQSLTVAGTVIISVRDSGAGISPEDQKSLFQEGLQFRANQLQAGGGSGLGLWIAKGVVELHAGTIHCQSEGEGLGSTFTVEIPAGFLIESNPDIVDALEKAKKTKIMTPPSSIQRARHCAVVPFEDNSYEENRENGCVTNTDEDNESKCIPSAQSREENNVKSSLPITPTSSSRTTSSKKTQRCVVRHILAVDDSAMSLKIVLRILRRQGYTCHSAVDGLDCLEKYASLVEEGVAIDVILMDYEMPRMNGPKATAELIKRGCHCPIIGVTGNALPGDKQLFKDHGAVAVLTKPLALADLEAIFKKLCKSNEVDAEAVTTTPNAATTTEHCI